VRLKEGNARPPEGIATADFAFGSALAFDLGLTFAFGFAFGSVACFGLPGFATMLPL
jgi:hypothetical protein